jgi:hypothetical protein
MDGRRLQRDRGAVLPMVLVVAVILAAVVAAVATYTAGTLRSGQVVESRADRLSAADGAMEDAIEQLELRRNMGALCGTLAGDGSGVNFDFPSTINQASVRVNCRIVGGMLPPVDGWALVITGLGPGGTPLPSGPSLEFTNGGKPEIKGPVYMHDPSTSWMTFAQETTIVEGDIWYPDTSCANAGGKDPADVNFERSGITVHGNLDFDPTTRGVYCMNQTWQQLFGSVGPVVPDFSTAPVDPVPDTTTIPGCTVWSPGVYDTAPAFTNNNYFRSGDYLFRDVGKMVLKGKAVHMGHDPSLAGVYPVTDNAPCDAARQADAPTGATMYTSGDTQIELDANSAWEISRRPHDYVRPGGAVSTSYVAFQVIDSSLSASQSLIEASSGAKKEFGAHGLFWAPHSSLLLDTVPAQKAAILRGGAVIGALEGGVTAAASGFVIEVPIATSNTKLLLTATATDTRGDTVVRVVADYRPVSGEVAVNSWRVLSTGS